MSMEKIMTPEEIRVELARRQITRRELAAALGISHDYVIRIVLGTRTATARRQQITSYLAAILPAHEVRGVA